MFTWIIIGLIIYFIFNSWKEILVTVSIVSAGSVVSDTFRKIMKWVFIYILLTSIYFIIKIKNFIEDVDKTGNRENKTEMIR